MHKQFSITIAALATVCCAFAAASTEVCSITRFGIYEMAGPQGGPWKVVSVEPTSEIHLKQGRRFGIDFEMSGISEQSAVVVATLTHPEITKPDGTRITRSVDQMGPFPVSDGHIRSSYGFTFDHEYEMVPGTWRIEITYLGKVVAEKSFSVVAGK